MVNRNVPISFSELVHYRILMSSWRCLRVFCASKDTKWAISSWAFLWSGCWLLMVMAPRCRRQIQSHSDNSYTGSEQFCFNNQELPGRPKSPPWLHLTHVRCSQFLASLKAFSSLNSLKGMHLQRIHPNPMLGTTNLPVQMGFYSVLTRTALHLQDRLFRK